MIQLPVLVQDAPIVRMQNAVLVGTMKFTLDQCDGTFTAGNPAPARLAAQLTEFRSSYGNLNNAFALTRESLITTDISNLDKEGDQLFIGAKETVEGARRMTYVPVRKQAGDRLNVFMKKYQIDVKENMIAEWSKLQQICEEANNSASLTADLATLGLTEMWARLTEIADLLRDKLTERSAELPALQVMKQAREAIYPEYRALMSLLNAYALTDSDTRRYETLIMTLNNNIDYVRIHAMGGGSATNSGSTDNGGSTENGGGDNENQNENQGGGSTGSDNGGSTGSDNGGSTGGDNGGSTGGDNGGYTGGDNGGGYDGPGPDDNGGYNNE